MQPAVRESKVLLAVGRPKITTTGRVAASGICERSVRKLWAELLAQSDQTSRKHYPHLCARHRSGRGTSSRTFYRARTTEHRPSFAGQLRLETHRSLARSTRLLQLHRRGYKVPAHAPRGTVRPALLQDLQRSLSCGEAAYAPSMLEGEYLAPLPAGAMSTHQQTVADSVPSCSSLRGTSQV